MGTTISSLIASADKGDGPAVRALFASLYRDLHRLARAELARRGYGVTLGATTLLHEAYLDISRRDGAEFPDRSRFMAYASRVMRGLIVDYARERRARKRGGEFEITGLDAEFAGTEDKEVVRLGEALDALDSIDSSLARVVDLKFFCGFSFPEIAELVGSSERTVRRQWEKARLYLYRDLRGEHHELDI